MQLWRRLRLVCGVACLLAALPAAASEYRGQVLFNGLPVPGASVTAVRGDAKLTAVTGAEGEFEFPDLADGEWTIRIEMTGFAAIDAKIAVAVNAPAGKWALTMLPLDRLMAMATQAPPASSARASRNLLKFAAAQRITWGFAFLPS